MSKDLILRRGFIKKAAVVVGSLLVTSPIVFAESLINKEEKNNAVSPDADLMREHGVLRRIILIYRESIHRIQNNGDLNPALITTSAGIIRHFIEDYHEKLEENFLFPQFEKAGHLTDLVAILKTQHQAGRTLTNRIKEIAASKNFKSKGKDFTNVTLQFIRMYEPHAAREDTVLFPAFQELVSASEYKEMGERFEDEEHKRFGKSGFNGIVSQVSNIEKELNIYDLSNFTPK